VAEMAADFKAMEVLDKNIGDGNGRRGRKLGRQKKKNLMCTVRFLVEIVL
jgi:hypothetical protein